MLFKKKLSALAIFACLSAIAVGCVSGPPEVKMTQQQFEDMLTANGGAWLMESQYDGSGGKRPVEKLTFKKEGGKLQLIVSRRLVNVAAAATGNKMQLTYVRPETRTCSNTNRKFVLKVYPIAGGMLYGTGEIDACNSGGRTSSLTATLRRAG